MSPLLRFVSVFLMSVATWGSALAQTSTQVEVGGAGVARKLVLGVAELAAFKPEQMGSVADARGVRLSALVEQAGLAGKGPNDWKTLVVIAIASDGYRAVFSWPELSNTATGDSALVLFERGGKALDEHEGRIALVSGADRKAGPRHVRNLVRIDVRPLD